MNLIKIFIRQGFIIIVLFIAHLDTKAAQTALSMPEEEIILISRLVKHTQEISRPTTEIVDTPFLTVDFSNDSNISHGITYKAGTIYKKDNKLYITFKDRLQGSLISDLVSNLNPFNYTKTSICLERNSKCSPIRGNIYKTFNNEFLHCQDSLHTTLREVLRNMSTTNLDIVFSGYERGGALATLAVAYLSDDFFKDISTTLKLVTFYPQSVGDKVFQASLERRIKIENILRFSSYFHSSEIFSGNSTSSHPGIGVFYTPTEDIWNYIVFPSRMYNLAFLCPLLYLVYYSTKTEGTYNTVKYTPTLLLAAWIKKLLSSPFFVAEGNLKTSVKFYRVEYDILHEKNDSTKLKQIGRVNVIDIQRNALMRLLGKPFKL